MMKYEAILDVVYVQFEEVNFQQVQLHVRHIKLINADGSELVTSSVRYLLVEDPMRCTHYNWSPNML